MQNDKRAWVRLKAFGLGLAAILAAFLTVQINPFPVIVTYLALLGMVIAIGLVTNLVGGLLASAASVFIIVFTNQYLGIYPRESFFVNVATELMAFMLAGPLAGNLAQAVEQVQRQAAYWLARAEDHAVHDETFGTLKPEWAKVRLEEEVLRAQRFSRPLSLVLFHLDPKANHGTSAAMARAERVAALQALIRLARAASPPPAVVTHMGGGQVLLMLPEHPPELAESVASTLCQQAEREVYFPGSGYPASGFSESGGKALGQPIHQRGQLQTAVSSLNAKGETAEEFLARAKAALEAKYV